MCAKSGGDAIGAPLLSIGCRPPSKWLNIVLDLNGVILVFVSFYVSLAVLQPESWFGAL